MHRIFLLMFISQIFPIHIFASQLKSSQGNVWKEVKPGGNTTCARGDDFSFFVSPGRSNNVIIDFIGGGACWDSFTCAKSTATFADNVEYIKAMQERGELKGIYERERDDNPFKDWKHVVIPYCTGDIHWGDSTQNYIGEDGEEFTIHHKGAVNVKSVLDWIKDNYTDPNHMLVTGCSAGSYGSIYWTPQIKELFPHAKLKQLGDSGAGVITEEFFKTSFPRWNAMGSAPDWIPGLNPDEVEWHTLKIEDLYSNVGNFYSNMTLAQVTAAYDDNQVFFYEMMGGDPDDWSDIMFGKMNSIEQSSPNFRSFVSPGTDHCILPYERFYTQESHGVLFKNWLKDFVGDNVPQTVHCVDCEPDYVHTSS